MHDPVRLKMLLADVPFGHDLVGRGAHEPEAHRTVEAARILVELSCPVGLGGIIVKPLACMPTIGAPRAGGLTRSPTAENSAEHGSNDPRQD